ncbi:MAG TPA: serine hydrolase domain-containing protein [Kofleriaceae bacterium]|nr:serine hydrolase domain-containing protein [Kofleriaceae bacterium]
MRAPRVAPLLLLIACSASPTRQTQPAPPAPADPAPAPAPAGPVAPAPLAKERLAADTPRTTVAGNTFVAPAGWTIHVRGPATILEAPEGDSHVALVDVPGKDAGDADAALELAWKAYKPDRKWPLEVKLPAPDRDGWSKITQYGYTTSPNEKRIVGADVRFANGTWTAVIVDAAHATGEKRGGQFAVIFGKLLPKGGARESFAGKQAHPLDAARIAELGKFVETAQRLIGVPGVGVGLVQGGKVVFAGGFGVRELGKPAKVDGDTRFIVASNTKALTTLMLGRLVDEKKLTWDTTAVSLLPRFKLGDPDTTSKVLVKHLICACTGMPRQDLEWILEYKGLTPEGALAALGTMQPTSKFGELFQYSNPLAAAAGFIGGHVAFPKLPLGAAYDEAMRTRVFAPLGMKATTFDFKKAQTGNFAAAHSQDLGGTTVRALDAVNRSVIPVRPAGGAWSTVRDMLRYVQMELAEGKLPDGKPYISRDVLLARRAPQIAIGTDAAYGMGLMVNRTYGVEVVHHGGDMIGFHSDMIWLPEHGVGAVVLTNGDGGHLIRNAFQRKLLEVLFDGRAEADAEIAAGAKQMEEQRAAQRKLLEVPANAAEAGKLAARYTSAQLGEIAVSRRGATLVFDFGEFASDMASQKNPDGTVSFVTISPGLIGVTLVVDSRGGKRALVLRDAQHEYVFEEK